MSNAIIARSIGDEYQGMIFWKYANKMLHNDSNIKTIKYEDSEIKSFDDIVITYKEKVKFRDSAITKDYIQVKFHMRQTDFFTVDNLLNPSFINAKKYSLMENIARSYRQLGKDFKDKRFIIYSMWDIDQQDILYKIINNTERTFDIDKIFDGTTPKSKMGKVRQKFYDQLNITEKELKEILMQTCIYSGQEDIVKIKELINQEFKYNGLKVLSESRVTNPYTDLIHGWMKHGKKEFDKYLLLEECRKEHLIISDNYLNCRLDDVKPDEIVDIRERFRKISTYNLSKISGKNLSINENLLVSREGSEIKLKDYLKSDKQVFAITGQSGYGKTNLMYLYWKELSTEYLVLFYPLGIIGKTLEEQMMSDLKKYLGLAKSIKDCHKYLSTEGCPIILMLDGVDEYFDINKLKNEIIDLLTYFEYNELKFIISCRNGDDKGIYSNGVWNNFLVSNGRKNQISEKLFLNVKGSSIELGELGITELEQFWNIYSKEYGTKILPGYELANIKGFEIPYFMSMACEVYRDRLFSKNLTMLELYDKWFQMKFSMFDNPQQCAILMEGVSEECFNESECTTVDSLYANERYFNNIGYIEKAIRLGILKKVFLENKTEAIRFVNAEFLYYVFVFLKLKIRNHNFVQIVPKLNIVAAKQPAKLQQALIFSYAIMYPEAQQLTKIPLEIYKEDKEETIICPICEKKLKKNDRISYIYRFFMEEFQVEPGTFYLCHHECSDKGLSIFAIIDGKKARTFNISDYVLMNQIIETLPGIAQKREAQINVFLKKTKLSDKYVLVYADCTKKDKLFEIGSMNQYAVPILRNKSIAYKYIKLLEPIMIRENIYSRLKVVQINTAIYQKILKVSNGKVVYISRNLNPNINNRLEVLDISL